MEKYRIDFQSKKIIITHKFERAMQNTDSEEYKLIKKLLADCPSLTVASKTRRSPSYYCNKDGTRTTAHPNKNITYEHMESFINALPNHDEYMKEYRFIKDIAAGLQINEYSLVNKWFVKQFPKFRSDPFFYVSNVVSLTDRRSFIQEATKKEEEAS